MSIVDCDSEYENAFEYKIRPYALFYIVFLNLLLHCICNCWFCYCLLTIDSVMSKSIWISVPSSPGPHCPDDQIINQTTYVVNFM